MAEPQKKDGAFWRGEIERCLTVRRQFEVWWDAEMRGYSPLGTGTPDAYAGAVNTNRTFTLVERKKADLFYRDPQLTLHPTPLMDGPILTEQVNPETGEPVPLMGPPDPTTGQQQPLGQHLALQAHQEIVNEKLGSDGIDASAMMDSVVFDLLCTQGVGFTKMGYESVTVPVEQPNPMTGQMMKVPVPIHEACYWHHFSGKKAIIPHDARSCEWDRLPYLGYQFELPLTAGNRQKYKLPADFDGAKTDGMQHFDHGTAQTPGMQVFTGVELWFRSCLYREDRPHPEHLTHLVLVDGVAEPVIEEDSPDQTLDPKGGLTPDSLIGFPIHPFHLRTMTDTAFIPSDCTMIRPLTNELNRFREQMVEYRDAMILRWMYNTDTLPPDALQKIVRSPVGGMIGVPGEAMNEQTIKELPHGSFPRESFTSNDYIDNDIARTSAMDASQLGVSGGQGDTATEQQLVQANANARLDKERSTLLKQYVRGATKFSTLVQRYLPVSQAAQIVGPQRAQVWDVWRKTVASALAFTALPDSALRVDQAVDRKASQDLYSFLANDPFVNRGELLAGLLRKFHLDPSKIVVQPEPPKPEPPKLALSFKGDDLVLPQAPIVLEILQQLGITVSPAAIQISQQALADAQALAAAQEQADAATKGNTKHGGKVAQQESLSKHSADETGGMQGTGAPAAMGAPGGMIQ